MNNLPISFAPLQGYTDAAYRNAHSLYYGGIDHYYTPFVRIEKGEFRNKDIKDISPENNQVPLLVPQLIAAGANEMERIINLLADKGYQEIDINLGCPFPMIVKKKKGSGILPYPEEVKSLLCTIHQFPDIRFSIKMRLGLHSADESLNLLPILNDIPLKHITMHPRLGIQQYKGEVDREGFSLFYEKCNQPLIYNGDIKSIEDITSIHQHFPKLSGIMIGRGLLTNPALALEYKNGEPLSATEFKKRLMQMHQYVFNHYQNRLEGGDAQRLNKIKTFWEYPEVDRKIKKRIHKCTRLSNYEEIIKDS
ncbi:tRNA-dihydrouridine synthase family protein [Bacteroides sp. 519]|uniref:tRNA-dihydrouridine synthase family protein n=1 Tax=Bacteroides sp. 519 TaxID=2302937 RepID=UPI0013D7722F|nr:tRNA-dihydrouridine synthase family protein [Bacteroides sp. 519]NDV59201.1 tRNA-dihydrouridine synthase family protein [Bacteroides sp. 519]